MDKEELVVAFRERLHVELLLFKDDMLQKMKTTVYEEAGMIAAYADIYEALVEKAESIPPEFLRGMTIQDSGILEEFYQQWLKREGHCYTELKEYVEYELENRIFGESE